ncbi:MAG: AarF/UbiB family protein [Deltaproteobacteria bacterium]
MAVRVLKEHIKFYRDLARLALKYGRKDLVHKAGLEKYIEDPTKLPTEERAKIEELPGDLEAMGPSFVKLGQLLSTRPDLIPVAYVKALAKLQDDCVHFPPEQSKEVIAEELGASVDELFSEFQDEPIAAASLGQVHFARLKDGTPVAVKVERPGIRREMLEHIHLLMRVARFIDRHSQFGRKHQFHEMLTEFRFSLLHELDYRKEADNLVTLKANLKEFSHIMVPEPFLEYTTSKVLTMEWIEGRKFDTLSPEELAEIDGHAIVDEVFRAYLKQIFVDGIFHADPHPGNLFIVGDDKIALHDLGIVGRIPHKLLELVLAIADGRGRDVADLTIQMGQVQAGFNANEFRRQLAHMIVGGQHVQVGEIQVGEIMTQLSGVTGYAGIKLPNELTLLGKALMNLDYIGHTLDPDFQPTTCLRDNAWTIFRQSLAERFSPWHLLERAVEIKDFAEEFPRKISRIMELMARNELTLNVINEEKLIEGLRNIANRVTVGIIIAAMILGASQLMRVRTPRYELFNYPALAIVLFLFAATVGIVLVLRIIFSSGASKSKGSR